ncbi:MAG TPA: LPS assembly lipoprotein LptE [Terriglobales bacterium]|nr:LPS assembly lipoprotein LptE [Terriglobales bacterium]
MSAPARLLAACLPLLLTGCGYHFVGTERQLPADIQSIGIGDIANHTRDRGAEKLLAFALEREIHTRRHYRLQQNIEQADAVLSGSLRRLERRPVAFGENDQAVIYELTMSVDLMLVRRDDGKTLWRVRDWVKFDEYSSNPRVVVTSSSDFQRDTLNPANLPRNESDGVPDHRQISAIQLADAERQRAIARLMASTVRDAYESMIEGF